MQSYESAQERRLKGALQAAASDLSTCAEDSCPAFIRNDCTRWSSEVEAEQPSISFSFTSAGRRLEQVQVTIDGHPLADRSFDQPFSVDPGMHRFRFEASGMQTAQRNIMINRRQKARLIELELEPLLSRAPAPETNEPSASESTPKPEPETEPESAPNFDTRTLVAGAIGLAGISGFAVLGLAAHADESHLRSSCAPSCSNAEISSLHTQYLMADLSLGIGVVALSVGSYWLFTGHPQPSVAQLHLPVRLQVGTHGASAALVGSF